MGAIAEQKPVKLIASIFFKDKKNLKPVEDRLRSLYGEIGVNEKMIPFDFTDYYYEEFGKPLIRKLICFNDIVDLENVPEIKIETNKIEDTMKINGKRSVNIDPGYITEAKLVLLTTKDYSHRIYIGNNIFAENTLYFQGDTFRSWPWTYPDYASSEMISYFNDIREVYMKDIHKNVH